MRSETTSSAENQSPRVLNIPRDVRRKAEYLEGSCATRGRQQEEAQHREGRLLTAAARSTALKL
jgi:hypothetical protein